MVFWIPFFYILNIVFAYFACCVAFCNFPLILHILHMPLHFLPISLHISLSFEYFSHIIFDILHILLIALIIDRMHYAARCVGYPSDSSLAEQQRARDSAYSASTLFASQPRRRASSPQPSPLAPLCCRARCRLLLAGLAGRVWPSPRHRLWPPSAAWVGAARPCDGHAGPGGPEPFTHCRPRPMR